MKTSGSSRNCSAMFPAAVPHGATSSSRWAGRPSASIASPTASASAASIFTTGASAAMTAGALPGDGASIATLPLADWPPFAVAPWRGGDGQPVVPVAFRRAIGWHLAALRQRSMSLDATSEAAIVPHLAELERHYRSKLGFYIACGHLIAALTAIHPRVDWEWMRRWRLDWRLAKLPRRQQVRPDQDLPFSALPFPQWPRELRQRWKANAPTSWRPLTAHEYRRAYGRFRAYCAQNGGAVAHTRQKLGAYVDFLAAATPATARCHVGLLHGALAVLFP